MYCRYPVDMPTPFTDLSNLSKFDFIHAEVRVSQETLILIEPIEIQVEVLHNFTINILFTGWMGTWGDLHLDLQPNCQHGTDIISSWAAAPHFARWRGDFDAN